MKRLLTERPTLWVALLLMLPALALGSSNTEFGDDENNDDESNDDGPVISAAVANVDASPPRLLLAGENFCDEPVVRAGTQGGLLEELFVFDSSASHLSAELVSTDPGSYRVELTCDSATAALDLTLGAVGPSGPPGPQGPPGEDGIIPGQSCPAGHFAVGFDLEGLIQCVPRPIVKGACPCADRRKLAELARLIREGLAAEPDASVLICSQQTNFADVLFESYPASGGPQTVIDLFTREDICGRLEQLPGAGDVRTLISIAPREAVECFAAVRALALELDCL